MSTQTYFEPSKRNPFGQIDDILMWFTHHHNLHIDFDARGDDIRLIDLPAGRITILPPKSDDPFELIFSFHKHDTPSKAVAHKATSRLEFLNLLESLLK